MSTGISLRNTLELPVTSSYHGLLFAPLPSLSLACLGERGDRKLFTWESLGMV